VLWLSPFRARYGVTRAEEPGRRPTSPRRRGHATTPADLRAGRRQRGTNAESGKRVTGDSGRYRASAADRRVTPDRKLRARRLACQVRDVYELRRNFSQQGKYNIRTSVARWGRVPGNWGGAEGPPRRHRESVPATLGRVCLARMERPAIAGPFGSPPALEAPQPLRFGDPQAAVHIAGEDHVVLGIDEHAPHQRRGAVGIGGRDELPRWSSTWCWRTRSSSCVGWSAARGPATAAGSPTPATLTETGLSQQRLQRRGVDALRAAPAAVVVGFPLDH
jgi:hypothetical protein